MLKLIIGVKGTGKTKALINLVNAASAESKGDVVCIEKGVKLRYDVKSSVRLINTEEYFVADTDALYGFIAVSGLKMLQNVNLSNNKNLFVVSVILITGIGGMALQIGAVKITTVACALIFGIIVNLIVSKAPDQE